MAHHHTPICPMGGDCTNAACQTKCGRMTGPCMLDFLMEGVKPAMHFVGFRPAADPQQWENAVQVFGLPDVIHYTWDQRAQREVAAGWDTVVFAQYHDMPPSPYNHDDSNQDDDPAAAERRDRS